MTVKRILLVTFIVACTAPIQAAADELVKPPSDGVAESVMGWGTPTYLYPFEEMVRRLEDPTRREWQTPERVLDQMGDMNGLIVYDLGAGTGYFSRMMVERGARVISADPDRRFLGYALGRRDAAGIAPEALEVRPIPYDDPRMADSEADWLLVVNTWHMVENRRLYLDKIAAGLKPGGRIAIVNHQKRDTPHGPPASHRMSVDETLAELIEAGFTPILEDRDFSVINYLIIAKRPE